MALRPHIDEALVARLVARQFPQWARLRSPNATRPAYRVLAERGGTGPTFRRRDPSR